MGVLTTGRRMAAVECSIQYTVHPPLRSVPQSQRPTLDNACLMNSWQSVDISCGNLGSSCMIELYVVERDS